jgi:hypothetical protein
VIICGAVTGLPFLALRAAGGDTDTELASAARAAVTGGSAKRARLLLEEAEELDVEVSWCVLSARDTALAVRLPARLLVDELTTLIVVVAMEAADDEAGAL